MKTESERKKKERNRETETYRKTETETETKRERERERERERVDRGPEFSSTFCLLVLTRASSQGLSSSLCVQDPATLYIVSDLCSTVVFTSSRPATNQYSNPHPPHTFTWCRREDVSFSSDSTSANKM